jgi:hypothetical protein
MMATTAAPAPAMQASRKPLHPVDDSKIRVLGHELATVITQLQAVQEAMTDISRQLGDALIGTDPADPATKIYENLYGQFVRAQAPGFDTIALIVMAQELKAFGLSHPHAGGRN